MIPDSVQLLPDGTAIISRTIPVPDTLSPQAHAHLATGATWAPEDGSPEQKDEIERALSMYPVQIEPATLAGVPVKIVQPPHVSAEKRDCVLMNLHGGWIRDGFRLDAGIDTHRLTHWHSGRDGALSSCAAIHLPRRR